MSASNPQPRLAARLTPLSRLVTRHPRKVLLVWLAVIGLLALQGIGLEHKLSSKPFHIDGTADARAHEIVTSQFGTEDSIVVMLEGPPAAVERQGDVLAHRLDALPTALVISPWTAGGAIDGLEPRPGVRAMLVSVENPNGRLTSIAPVVQRQVDRAIAAPVRASVAGGPQIADSVRDSIEAAAALGEKLAIPALLIVLLFVCRSLIGAAMPIVVGGAVVVASKGAMSVMNGYLPVDPFALGAASMLGLALGVDYSLLVVSRYRQERQLGGELDEVVRRTVVATGQSVVPAGSGLLLAMLLSALLLAGPATSIVLAAALVAVLSVLSALFAIPAMLVLVGPQLDRWSLPPRADEGGAVMRWSRWVSSRPPLVLGILFAMVVCAFWALGINTRAGSPQQLPPDDSGRLAQEAIQRELGPGWVGPLEVVMNGRDRPVTTAARLHALSSFQRRLEGDPGVASMTGFRSFEKSTDELGGVESKLAGQGKGLGRLGHGIAKAKGGADAVSDGFVSASEGAQQLGSAAGLSRSGSSRLAAGLRSSSRGSAALRDGLDDAHDGSGDVAEGASKASNGADKLADKLSEAEEKSGESSHSAAILKGTLVGGEEELAGAEAPLGAGVTQLEAAWRALQQMTSGQDDPQYRPSLDAVESSLRSLTGADPGAGATGPDGVAAGISRGKEQVNSGVYLAGQMEEDNEKRDESVAKLAEKTEKLADGLEKLKKGTRKLSSGIGRLSGGGEKLTPGLTKLTAGAERLSGGLGQLEDGAESLSGGLGGGAQRSRLLAGGLQRIHGGVVRQRDDSDSDLDGLREGSPRLFKSGYFYLAGFDGVQPRRRTQAGMLINLDRGGTAARMIVIPAEEPTSAAGENVTERVREQAARLQRETGAEVLVAGWGPQMTNINNLFRDRGPITRVVLSLVTILIIFLVTRSLALALLAAAFNLLTVSTTFGLLALLFDDKLLGGPGFVDPGVIAAAVTLVFGLAIDYEVFIFARVREEYLRTGSTLEAIDRGHAQTAHVITGAALIMCAVFIAFSVSELMTLRNLGVCLTITTLIDALLIRFVLVPAAMRALGDRSWWTPRWLMRMMPAQARRPTPRGADA